MIFASPVFLFAFLPLFLLAYYASPIRARTLVILVGSWLFYGWWRSDFLLLLIAVSFWSWWLGQRIEAAPSKRIGQYWMVLGIVLNLGTLGWFKYANFGIDNLNLLLTNLGAAPMAHATIILPVGISFFVFQAVSYLVDVWRCDAPATGSFTDLAAFLALFPQLIAGPVLRYKDIAHQFASRAHSWATFAEGCRRFILGLAMKVLLADPLAPLVERTFASPEPGFADAWLGALAYTAQLFFDFAGYSTMAVGLGLMLGFRFMENFRVPYASRSITEFWQRWHISLSTWLRDYLYIPLGGNRGGRLLTARNLLLTMVLGGLWHGANWTFVVWGLWHGLWMVAERAAGPRGLWPPGSRTIATLLIVMLGWVLFRAADLPSAFSVLAGLIGAHGFGGDPFLPIQRTPLELGVLCLAWLTILIGVVRERGWMAVPRLDWKPSASLALSIQSCLWTGLFVIAATRLVAASATPFLYFQF